MSSVRAGTQLIQTRARPWKDLYKISSNWRRGNARRTTLSTSSVRAAVLAEAPTDLSLGSESDREDNPSSTSRRILPPPPSSRRPNATPSPLSSATSGEVGTLVQFYKHYFFTASRAPSIDPSTRIPSVSVHQTTPTGDSILFGNISSTTLLASYAARPDFRPSLYITELRLDERPLSPSSQHESRSDIVKPVELRLAIFFSTGQSCIFRIFLPTTSTSFTSEEMHSSLALSTLDMGPMAFDPVVIARYFSPLIVTCSRRFALRFWRLEEDARGIRVEEVEGGLQTRESWAPVVLSLTKVDAAEAQSERRKVDDWAQERESEVPRQETFKVTLAYSTPLFPDSWTVGVQEIMLQVPSDTSQLSTGLNGRLSSRIRVTSRHAIATPERLSATLAPHHFPRRQIDTLVTSIEHSDPFIVTSRSNNTLDVYEVVSSSPPVTIKPPSSSRTISTRDHSLNSNTLSVVHRRTLFGHTARVASVAVEGKAGRCVSAGDDGAVKVWQLTSSKSRREPRPVDVVEAEVEEEEDLPARSVWQEMKARRSRGMAGRAEGELRPHRVRKVLFDEEKIVCCVQADEMGGGGESVRVLRFD